MKNLKKDLTAVNKELKALVKKTESLMKAVDKIEKAQANKAVSKPAKKTVAKESVKKPEQPTAYATFLGFINRSKKGLGVEQLKTKTGFNAKKIANLVYKAKKQGKINICEGVIINYC